MFNNCYTVLPSPVFRNPKSNVAVSQLNQLIQDTSNRSQSPLQPQTKKIIGIKKNVSQEKQQPLCEVPFHQNVYQQQESYNDLAYSNRSQIQTNRQFSRNQRTQSVYTINKENYIRSPQRSPFIKPIIQRDCHTPIYRKSPLQRLQSPCLRATITPTQQKGYGSISPLRIPQQLQKNKIHQLKREPQLSEMVDNLKQNILRDIQEVTKKYTNAPVLFNKSNERSKTPELLDHGQYEELKQQEFRKQQYLEQQAFLLQQQLDFIKQQQSKFSDQNKLSICSQENYNNKRSQLDFKHFDLQSVKSIDSNKLSHCQDSKQGSLYKQDSMSKTKYSQEKNRFLIEQANALLSQQQQEIQLQERLPLQNLTKFQQQDYIQQLNQKIEQIQKQQNNDNLKQQNEFKVLQNPNCIKYQYESQNINTINNQKNETCNNNNKQSVQKQAEAMLSPTNFKKEKQITSYLISKQSSQSPIGYTNSSSEQNQLKNIQIELMQNKQILPIQKLQQKDYKKQYDIIKQIENKIDQVNQKKEQYNLEKLQSTNSNITSNKQQKSILPQFAAYLPKQRIPDDNDDENNQVTISNLSSIIPVDISTNQNKKINVSFESSMDQQQQLGCYSASDCRNTFGPLQLQNELKPQQQQQQQQFKEYTLNNNFTPEHPEFDLNSSRNNNNNFNQYENINNNQDDQEAIEIESRQCTMQLEQEIKEDLNNQQNNLLNQKLDNRNSRQSIQQQNEIIPEQRNFNKKQNDIEEEISNFNNENSIVQNQTLSKSKASDKYSSGQSQRYSGFKEQQNQENEKILSEENDSMQNTNTNRYEQIIQNFQSLKNQSKLEIQETQQIQSVQINECEHISDFVVFQEKAIENNNKKKTVTFNEQLIQKSIDSLKQQQKATSFTDFIKTKTIEIPTLETQSPQLSEQEGNGTLPTIQGGISFLQYKQQLEN